MLQEEKKEILVVCNSEEFESRTPCEIVPILVDGGICLVVKVRYKVLKEANQLVLHSDNGIR